MSLARLIKSLETGYETPRVNKASLGQETPRRTFFEVLDVATGQRDADFVQFCGRDGRPGRVIVFLTLRSDVTHF